MNFELTPEQQTLQQDAIEFARGELNSNIIERDAQQVSSHDRWKKCAFFEVQGMPIPKEYGGRGADPITTIAMMEGLGYRRRRSGLLFSMQTRARKDGSDEVLTGRKIFVTKAPVADAFTSCATLDLKLGAAGISNTTFLLLHSGNPNGKRAAILSRAR